MVLYCRHKTHYNMAKHKQVMQPTFNVVLIKCLLKASKSNVTNFFTILS